MATVVALTNLRIICSLKDSYVCRGTIRISDGKILEVAEEPGPDDVIVDMAGRVALPGLVVGHHHLYSALARGMPAPARTPSNFVEVLEYVWWVLDRALDEESIRMSGYAGLLGAARLGITGVIDHHASPNLIDGSLDLLAESFRDIGIRGLLTYEVTDRGGRERARAGIRENVRFIEAHRNDPMLRGTMGGHASFTMSDETLDEMAAECSRLDTGLHIHVLEDAADRSASEERYGADPLTRLSERGLVRQGSILAHLVHATPEELQMVADSGALMVHNPRSNMNNRVGHAAVEPGWILGTDGIDSNIIEESKAAFYLARHEKYGHDYDLPLALISRTQEAFGEMMGLRLGKIGAGYEADITFLRYEPPTPLADTNVVGHLLFGLGSWAVSETMVAGRFIYRNGEVQGPNEQEIMDRARTAAQRLWRRMEDLA